MFLVVKCVIGCSYVYFCKGEENVSGDIGVWNFVVKIKFCRNIMLEVKWC